MLVEVANKSDEIANLCRKYKVARLYVFGSALRDDFRPDESDIDLLVEFEPIGGHAKMHAYFEMLDELQALLGAKVDLVMSGGRAQRVPLARDRADETAAVSIRRLGCA